MEDRKDADIAAVLQEARRAFQADDAEGVRALLARHPAIRAMIGEPIGPFDSPAIVNVRSRAMLDVLLEGGADINARSRWWAGGFGLLDSASPELAAYAIERGATVDANAAARLGMVERVRQLIARDPDAVHARGGDGQTPLHVAATVEIAALLLDAGADIDALDVDHESTPAQYMTGGREDVARFLVSRRCRTDIFLAAALGDLDLARRHLDANPGGIRMRVDADSFPMSNPRAGGTIYQWTLGFHVSPHQVAKARGHTEVLRLLLERSSADVRLMEACWIGDGEAARALLAEHPDIVGRLSGVDRRQIAHAARNNNNAAVRLMLEIGFPVDASGQHAGTPLHWAAFHGNAEMAEILLRFNPPLELRDADFEATPLGWAIHGSEHGWYCETGDYAGVVEALLRAGATRPAEIAGSAAVREVLRHRGSKDEGV